MNILFVSSCNSPFNPQQGGEQRSHLLLKACMKYGVVDVISFCTDSIEDSYGANVLFSTIIPDRSYSLDTRKEKFIKMIGSVVPSHMTTLDKQKEKIIDYFIGLKKYDVIVIRYAFCAINCGLYKYANKLYVDVDDNPIKSIMVRGLASNTLLCRVFFWIYQKNVAHSFIKFKNKIFSTTFSNYSDALLYDSLFLPNIPFYNVIEPLPLTDVINGRLLFVGDLTYEPNKEAMNQFVAETLPMIQHFEPNVTLHIVGKCSNQDKHLWSQCKGVEVLGYVESLTKEYSQANVFILPMPEGAGTCIKFLEAAQMGRPIVTSRQGFNGYETIFQSNRDCLVANDKEEFAKCVTTILRNKDLATSLVISANICLKNNYSRERYNIVVGQALGYKLDDNNHT